MNYSLNESIMDHLRTLKSFDFAVFLVETSLKNDFVHTCMTPRFHCDVLKSTQITRRTYTNSHKLDEMLEDPKKDVVLLFKGDN